MKQEIKDPRKKSHTGNYSAAVLCDGWLFVSGNGPLDMMTGEVISGSIEEETRLTLENVERVLHAAGCTRDNVVKSTCHLADFSEFDRFDRAYGDFFTGVRPARTTVQSGLGMIKIEIDVVARVPDRSGS